ncbi:hypothetical protein GMO_01360 [Gluconobacter morbifer G707]|uniref:Acyltransferase 3 domain-containing protein n=1 Tax=Gluconobacter morbifer G707 TaxID=1088869 RepID=G6XF71_9PROT|nr:hypothetical protein GMO_01360 [Gluconobacter morbifer G707]
MAAAILPAPILGVFAYDGGDAVVLFFVISGFLITRRCMDRFGSMEAISSPAFYAHRAARILPCLFLLMSVLACLDQMGLKDFSFNRPTQTLGGAVLAVLTCTFNWYEGWTNHWAPASWDVLWSLSIEEAFYIGFPLLCLLPLRPRIALLLVLIVLGPIDHGHIPSAYEIWREKAYLPGFGALATGILAAMLSQRIHIGRSLAYSLIVLGFAGCCMELIGDMTVWRVLGEWTIWFLSFGGAAMLLAFDALEKMALSTAPSRGLGWLQRMGRLSYEIYLSHMFLVLPAVVLFAERGGRRERSGLMVYVLTVPACVLLGRLIAALWSRPAARFLDRLTEERLPIARPSSAVPR